MMPIRGRHASSANECRQPRQARRKCRSTLTTLAAGDILQSSWGCSSAGRAQGWQSWGQGFEPPQLHQPSRKGHHDRFVMPHAPSRSRSCGQPIMPNDSAVSDPSDDRRNFRRPCRLCPGRVDGSLDQCWDEVRPRTNTHRLREHRLHDSHCRVHTERSARTMVDLSRWRLRVVVPLLVAAVSAGACQGKEDEAIRTARIYDLLKALPRATLKAPASNYISARSGAVAKEERRALFMHPPSSAEFPPVKVEQDSILQFAIGIQDEAWDKPGDGVEFTALVRGSDGKVTKVFSRYIDPKHTEQDRHWIGVRVPLRAFAGQTIRVVLTTSPGPANNDNSDWAFWADPEIVLAGQ